MNIPETIKKFILNEVAVDVKKKIDLDDDLLEQGIIDSLGIMKLIVFIEETFGITVNDEEIVPENFQTLNSMARFVEEKMRHK